MNTQKASEAIKAAFLKCRQCEELMDSWPDADTSEPGEKVVYIPRDALFVGICSQGHVNEVYLAEVKAGEPATHDVTERRLGYYCPQDQCKHHKTVIHDIQEGCSVPTASGPIEGPCKTVLCGLCGHRRKLQRPD